MIKNYYLSCTQLLKNETVVKMKKEESDWHGLMIFMTYEIFRQLTDQRRSNYVHDINPNKN